MKGPKAPNGFRRLRFGEIIKRGDKVARYNQGRWISATNIGSRYSPHDEAGGEDMFGDHVHIRRK